MLLALARRRFLATLGAAIALSKSSLAHAARSPAAAETARLNAWLEERFKMWTGRSPMQQGYLGLKTDLDKWDDLSEAFAAQTLSLAKKDLADLQSGFKLAALTPEGQLSYRLYAYEAEEKIADDMWRHHAYPVNQLEGWQQELPTFLMNVHGVGNVAEAQAYIVRLRTMGTVIDQLIERMRLGEAAGVLAPRFVYGHVIRDCRNIISGAPFDSSGKDSPLFADIKTKIDGLKAGAAVKQRLKADAEKALMAGVQPGFVRLIAATAAQQEHASTDDGVWKLPNGEAFYAHRLKYSTTTDMTADAIHAFGLSEVERIHGEIRAIMKKVGFAGDLQAFFKFVKQDPQFYFPQTPDGKAAYIAATKAIIDGMRPHLDDVFIHKPKAELVVKEVEPFREQSATSAFYEQPGAFDGRPGIYYINTYDMTVASKFEMEATAYHEAIPGHHMQIALTQESPLPSFRRFNDSYTAYVEGWALYSERLAKEMGFYRDPYSDFGRLSAELLRAGRLVVDTGLHSANRKWSREKTIAYLQENTANSDADITNSVERYIVSPGQATSYKIGMTKITELREAAKAKLGPKFDIRAYHDVVLGHGALPLTFLSETVDAWVKQKLAT